LCISKKYSNFAGTLDKCTIGFQPNGGLKLRQMHDCFLAKRRIEIALNARFVAKIFAHLEKNHYLCSAKTLR
jgi:hypothetical protein